MPLSPKRVAQHRSQRTVVEAVRALSSPMEEEVVSLHANFPMEEALPSVGWQTFQNDTLNENFIGELTSESTIDFDGSEVGLGLQEPRATASLTDDAAYNGMRRAA